MPHVLRRLAFACLCILAAVPAAAAPGVHVVRPPEGAFVPDVAVDAKGVLHMVYALDRNAYYVRSADNGATFTQPVRVNAEGSVEFRMGERGPKLSVGADRVIHVAWQDFWAPGVQTRVRYARSLDGGKTFGKVQTVSAYSGVDGVTMAADGAGTVWVFYHTAVPPQTTIPQATWLHVVRSGDNGASFGEDRVVEIDGALTPLACSMCMTRARATSQGVFLAFRSAENNIRDLYVLTGSKGSPKLAAVRVNLDDWELKTCPMCGPELTLAPGGRLICAYMSRHRVYWSAWDGKAAAFALHVATPAPEEDEIYPTAVANRSGEVLMVWQVGPMSTTGTATVKWARYTADGKPTGEQGSVGTTTSGTKATAFVGSDDGFYVVTTAR